MYVGSLASREDGRVSASPSTANALGRLAPRLKFTGSDRFIRELRRRVDAYFEGTGQKRRDCPKMYFKTASILAWFFGAYFLLLFAVHSLWLIVPLAKVPKLIAPVGMLLRKTSTPFR